MKIDMDEILLQLRNEAEDDFYNTLDGKLPVFLIALFVTYFLNELTAYI